MVEPKGKNYFNAQIDQFALSVLPNLPVLVELFRPVISSQETPHWDADSYIIVELLLERILSDELQPILSCLGKIRVDKLWLFVLWYPNLFKADEVRTDYNRIRRGLVSK